eukprot:m.8308 g.8308  ORF g.8308 m.8308 type:complete len:117 (+) comp5419_c0_seq1:54-404(+)
MYMRSQTLISISSVTTSSKKGKQKKLFPNYLQRSFEFALWRLKITPVVGILVCFAAALVAGLDFAAPTVRDVETEPFPASVMISLALLQCHLLKRQMAQHRLLTRLHRQSVLTLYL